MKATIKQYIEELNNLSDLHMSNLITYITNIYGKSIVYIKFVKLNNYETLYQSISKKAILADSAWEESQRIPEFISINTISKNNLDVVDIDFDVIIP